jgi:hypothetical protein
MTVFLKNNRGFSRFCCVAQSKAAVAFCKADQETRFPKCDVKEVTEVTFLRICWSFGRWRSDGSDGRDGSDESVTRVRGVSEANKKLM